MTLAPSFLGQASFPCEHLSMAFYFYDASSNFNQSAKRQNTFHDHYSPVSPMP
jgi:hypothetical protein